MLHPNKFSYTLKMTTSSKWPQCSSPIVLLMLIVMACSVAAYFHFNNPQEVVLTDNAVIPEIEYVEYQTGMDPVFSVIWLHGLGADGHDFEPVAPQLGISRDIPVRFIFPHAPQRSITVNGGMVMRGWYDIVDLPVDPQQTRREDRAGLEESFAIVRELIAQENRRGIATEHIFLAGFSQGGAVALFAGLRLEQKIAGIIALSTYLPHAGALEAERSEANREVAIFYGQGTQDPLIPLEAAEKSRDLLEQFGYSVEWHTYEMPHSVHPAEIRQIGEFINGLLIR